MLSVALFLLSACTYFAAAGAHAATPRSSSTRAFFPSRPPNAKLRVATGILVEFGIGNGLGGLELRQGKRIAELYTGSNLRLNGRPVTCDHPPKAGAPQSMFCRDWPQSVVIGSTRIEATYWLQARPGFPGLVKVTDNLRSAAARK